MPNTFLYPLSSFVVPSGYMQGADERLVGIRAGIFSSDAKHRIGTLLLCTGRVFSVSGYGEHRVRLEDLPTVVGAVFGILCDSKHGVGVKACTQESVDWLSGNLKELSASLT